MSEENQQWMMEALEAVYAEWYNYTHATSVIARASYLINFNDRLHDLFTYHPRFNYRTGEIDGVFDD